MIKGIVIVYVILAVVYLISPLMKKGATDAIENSYLTKTLYNNNILLNIII